MSIAETISPHIPYLRRFARALAGTQAGGDAYALATLEAIVADPKSLDMGLDVARGPVSGVSDALGIGAA